MKLRARVALIFLLWVLFPVPGLRRHACGMEGFRLLPAPEQDLSLRWNVLESEHFRVTFPSHLAGTAETIRSEAERTLALLVEWSGGSLGDRGSTPRAKKIDIVVSDKSDAANGFVSIGPKGYYITLYAVHPYGSASEGLDSYGDWYRDLLVHELAHYFHLDAVDKFARLNRRIFGYVAHPNSYLPPFVKEGFATYAETFAGKTGAGASGGDAAGVGASDAGASGRGVSPVTGMYLRTSVSEGDFLGLDRACNDVVSWPGAQGHYLFGVSFLEHLADTSGEEKMHEFNRMTSGTLPYLWNPRFREIYGVGMSAAWREWREAEENAQAARIGSIEGEGLTAPAPVSRYRGTVYSLDLDPSGRYVVYAMRPPTRTGGLYLYDRRTGRERLLDRGIYPKSVSFDEGGRLLYYLRGERRRNVDYKQDLFAFDIKKRNERRITKNGSIQGFAALKQEGTYLLCVSTPRGTRIAVLEEGGASRDLLDESSLRGEDGIVFTVVSDPAVSPGGRDIAFSCRNGLGDQSVCTAALSALEGGRVVFKRISPPGVRAYGPRWLDDRAILYVSDEGGVYNLHRVDTRTLERERVCNVVGGLFDARAAAGLAAVKEYTSGGFRVSIVELAGETPPPDPGSQTRASPRSPVSREGRSPAGEGKEAADAGGSGGQAQEAGPYRSRRRLFPGYWLPFDVGDGIGFGIGFSTSGGDLLRRHVYDAGIVYDIPNGILRARFSYLYNVNQWVGPFLSVSASELPPFEEISPAFASYAGVQTTLRGTFSGGRSELGAIFEGPYRGPNLLLEYDSLKTSYRLMGPERGVLLRQEAFLDSSGDDLFVLTDTASLYVPFVGFSVLSWHAKLRGGFGDLRNPVASGLIGAWDFVPLNGILTPGYPDPVRGEVVVSARSKLLFPLFTSDRGLNAFPLLFEGLAVGAMLDAGIVFSDEDGPHASRPEDERFVAPSLGAAVRDPSGYIRASAGIELKAGFIIGYEYPLDVVAGYTFALSAGGRDGPYVALSFDFGQ